MMHAGLPCPPGMPGHVIGLPHTAGAINYHPASRDLRSNVLVNDQLNSCSQQAQILQVQRIFLFLRPRYYYLAFLQTLKYILKVLMKHNFFNDVFLSSISNRC